MEKFFRLTNQALEVLKTPEVKLQLMLFFEVNDARTIESYLKDNVPNGPLMNICVRDLILDPSTGYGGSGQWATASREFRASM